MTNEEKAREISDIYMPETGFTREDLYDAAMEMAKWKDQKFVEEKHKIIKKTNASVNQSFENGAEWKDEQLINKACEWLTENIYHRVYECGDKLGFPTADFIKEFRKAMEG